MQLKVTPQLGPRYWVAIMIASMCGTNFGDFFPDILKVPTGIAMAILAGLFALIVAADRMTPRGSEVYYWLSILVVRAAATQIADFTIDKQHLGYIPVGLVMAVILGALLVVHGRGVANKAGSASLPPTNALYWFTMLTAGSLGTIVGDGVGHAFGKVSIGVPISAGLATVALALMLGARARLGWMTAASYWLSVVVVRWWGTNFGDIFAFLASLGASMVLTGVALALTLLLWRTSRSERPDTARAAQA